MLVGELVSQLRNGTLQLAPSSIPLSLINKARREIYKQRDWSFLFTESYIVFPKLINSGLVSVVNNDINITFDATAKAALNATSSVNIIGRQFRVVRGNSVIASNLIYTITAYDGTSGIAVLDKPYLDETNANSSYEVFKSIFTIINPNTNKADFRKFFAFVDTKNNNRIYLPDSFNALNRLDPTRITNAEPTSLYHAGKDSSNNPLFELYPAYRLSNDRVYKIAYFSKGVDYTDDDLDLIIPEGIEDLIEYRVKMELYEWCDVNKGTYSELQKTNWQNLLALNKAKYDSELIDAKNQDEETFSVSEIISYYNQLSYIDLGEWGSPYNPPREIWVMNF